jgi:hypothetical protein
MNVFLYIDATTGGMALQVILSGLVGGLVVIKLFWRNFVNTIFRRNAGEDDEEDQPSPTNLSTEASSDYNIDSTAS